MHGEQEVNGFGNTPFAAKDDKDTDRIINKNWIWVSMSSAPEALAPCAWCLVLRGGLAVSARLAGAA